MRQATDHQGHYFEHVLFPLIPEQILIVYKNTPIALVSAALLEDPSIARFHPERIDKFVYLELYKASCAYVTEVPPAKFHTPYYVVFDKGSNRCNVIQWASDPVAMPTDTYTHYVGPIRREKKARAIAQQYHFSRTIQEVSYYE